MIWPFTWKSYLRAAEAHARDEWSKGHAAGWNRALAVLAADAKKPKVKKRKRLSAKRLDKLARELSTDA